jgi:prepilin-type N-terminal cleavage/methylation domain-containing protein
MNLHISKSQRGFSLLELMISAVIGLVIMAAMTSLFRVGMTTTFTVTQRAETQQNLRAGIEMMTKDISLAGAGLPSGGLQLPNSNGNSKIACNQAGTCYVPADIYPTVGGTPNYMSGIIPGFGNGVQNGTAITSAPGAVNDSITSIYCDYNFSLANFQFSFPVISAASAKLIAAPDPTLPTNLLQAGGLSVGDLLLFLVQTPGNGKTAQGTSLGQTAMAVGEITGLPAGGPPWTVDFAAADPLNFNGQVGPNSLANAAANFGGVNQVSVCRLYAVTYFLQVPPAGGTVQTPRLMRQVNGSNAVPVADNIINLQFSYDVINSVTSTIDANQANPIAAGDSPALIQKVNMWIMGQGLTQGNNRSQSMYLASSVATRNTSFCDPYSSNTKVCQ